jgi:predicted DNA-binding protein
MTDRSGANTGRSSQLNFKESTEEPVEDFYFYKSAKNKLKKDELFLFSVESGTLDILVVEYENSASMG